MRLLPLVLFHAPLGAKPGGLAIQALPLRYPNYSFPGVARLACYLRLKARDTVLQFGQLLLD